MKNTFKRLIRWFCSCLTENEFNSIMVILLEIQSGQCKEFKFRPERPSKNYRRFTYDDKRALNAQAVPETMHVHWRDLLLEYEQKTGKPLKAIRRQDGAFSPPEHCTCECCGAPSKYLYLNDGKKGNQIRCKVCGKLSVTERVRRQTKAKYACPYCSGKLFLWKERATESIYKCPNRKCPHYLKNKTALTPVEQAKREANIYDPNYKLHYQYREYHIDPKDLECRRPEVESTVDLRRIHNSLHVVGLVLSLFMNVGLSVRQTREVLSGLFGIKLSHQTVLNYVNAAAAIVFPWLDRNLPQPRSRAAADETYIFVDNEHHYTWFIIDEMTRAICGYNLSDTRGTAPALATIHNAYGPPEENIGRRFFLAKDGLGSYDDAIMAYNQQTEKNILFGKTVIGLENLDDMSAKYRPLKQLVERLNRTYKFHTRPRAGFKTLDGAASLTTLFVAYYNFLRKHSARKHSPPVPIPELQGVESFPKQWEIILQLAAAA